MNLSDILNTGENLLTGSSNGSQLLRGGLGALLAYKLAPRYRQMSPISAGTLDAATIPMMQRQVRGRIASMLATQGAKGGLSASDVAERNYAKAAMEEQIAHQRALDQITANNSYNQTLDYNNKANMMPWENAIAGGLVGSNMFHAPAANPGIDSLNSRIQALQSMFSRYLNNGGTQ